MMNSLEGGNWQNGAGTDYFYNRGLASALARRMVPFAEVDTEGLPERWIKIIRKEVRWGRTDYFRLLLDVPEAHCEKEGLWRW